MDLELLLAQWSGTLPPGFVRPAILRTDLPNLPRLRSARYVFAPAPREPLTSSVSPTPPSSSSISKCNDVVL